MSEGGPLAVEEILPHLDMDASILPAVQEFSLNYHMLNDDRFDEVAPVGKVAWFLRRLEPESVQTPPQRLTGVIFIPPHLVQEVVERSEDIRVRDEFGKYCLRQGLYTPGEIDRVWSEEIEADYQKWLAEK
jgi:hypothetical protein